MVELACWLATPKRAPFTALSCCWSCAWLGAGEAVLDVLFELDRISATARAATAQAMAASRATRVRCVVCW